MISIQSPSPLVIIRSDRLARSSFRYFPPPGPLQNRSSSIKCMQQSHRPTAEVKVKGSQLIQPTELTLNGTVPLTPGDEMLSSHYISALYFYKSSDNLDVSSTLRDSLARTLVHFYPFAGRIISHHTTNTAGSVELRLEGGGAVLTEAESSNELGEFGDFSDLSRFKNLIPSVEQYHQPSPKKIPVLQVQLTKFRCGGYSLGILMSHAVVDGRSAIHFTKEWARNARGEPMKTPPFIDRSVLGATTVLSNKGLSSSIGQIDDREQLDGRSNYVEKKQKEEKKVKKMATKAILTLSKNQIEKLKNLVVDSNNISNSSPSYTRYEVVASYLWRCYAKTMGHDGASKVPMALGIYVDVRGRLQPRLPSQYFGNAIYLIAATGQAGQIISDHRLGFTCEKLRQAIDHVTDDYIRSHMIQDIKSVQETYPITGEFKVRSPTANVDDMVKMDISVVSWLSLPLYDLDFGFGKEICMRPGPEDRDAEIVIMRGQDIHEKGHLDVIVCLPQHQLDCFKMHFYQDLQ